MLVFLGLNLECFLLLNLMIFGVIYLLVFWFIVWFEYVWEVFLVLVRLKLVIFIDLILENGLFEGFVRLMRMFRDLRLWCVIFLLWIYFMFFLIWSIKVIVCIFEKGCVGVSFFCFL